MGLASCKTCLGSSHERPGTVSFVSANFWLRYALDMVVVALMLGGMYAVVRGIARGRVIVSTRRRIVTVLESTMLSQHNAIHVVKVGSRYLLLGAGNGHVTALGELSSEDVEKRPSMG
jgi:flagellar biogenesis protein FliO